MKWTRPSFWSTLGVWQAIGVRWPALILKSLSNLQHEGRKRGLNPKSVGPKGHRASEPTSHSS